MLADIYKEILDKKDIRENTIKLKEELKTPANLSSFKYMLAGEYNELTALFDNEDPKVRKNTATILGMLGDSALVKPLWNGYKSETTLLAKDAYLKAIGKLNYAAVKSELSKELERITGTSYDESELKHIREITATLNKLCGDKKARHTFTGFECELPVIVSTSAVAVDVLFEKIADLGMHIAKKLKGGIAVFDGRLSLLGDIRYANEILISLSDFESVDGNPISLACFMAAGKLMKYLGECHNGNGAFRYRVELRGETDKDKEGTFIKRFSGELERKLPGKLINDPSDYEIEIRLVKNKEGRILPLVKLLTYKDRRFEYRKNVLPVSIHPVNAGIMMELARKYFREDARVLDPMCGVGTLLIERKNVMPAQTLYGIDKFGKAIDMARENAKAADMVINYINRDYFDFTHEHKFDEIVCNLPGATGKTTREEIKDMYREFFKKSSTLLNENAVICVVTNEKGYVQSAVDTLEGYTLCEEFVLSKKDERYILVIKYC